MMKWSLKCLYNRYLLEWSENNFNFILGRGVLGSKATGEPATHMALSAVLALKNALDAGRLAILKKDPKEWISLCKYYICLSTMSFLE